MTLHGCVVTLNRIEVYDTHVEVLEDVRLVNHVLVFLAMLRSSKSFLRPQGTDDENSGDPITVCVLLLYVFIGQSISANPPDCLLKGDLPHMSTSPTISLVLESFGRIPFPTDSQRCYHFDPVHAGGKKRAVNPLHQVAPRMLRCPWFILQQKSNTFLTVIRKVSTLFPGVRECKNNGALEDSLTDGTRRWVSTGMHISIAVPAVVPKDARMVRLRFNAGTVYVHWQEFRFLLSTRLDVAKGNGITQHYFDFDKELHAKEAKVNEERGGDIY